MRSPDCRTDKHYNQKFLVEEDKQFVAGYDWAVEQILNLLEANMDVYEHEFDIEGEDINLVRFLENHKAVHKVLAECADHWMEMERNELITSMLDNTATCDDDESEVVQS